MKWWNKQTALRITRAIHRDLGFLMVGVSIVYGISGILLNHMNGKDPAYKTEIKSVQLDPQLDKNELLIRWKDQDNGLPNVKKTLPIDQEHIRLLLDGGVGVYNIKSGLVDYEKYTQRKFVYWINRLHYNKVSGWHFMGDFFAVSLLFFAISGLFMVKGKKGIGGRGKWYLLVGLAIPVAYILFTL